jgi:hypothetical protein
MSTIIDNGSPGSHPHSNRPNWQPGDNDADELLQQKIADALRDGKGERHIAKLLGVSRMALWRGKILSEIPHGLLERLCAARVGIKAMIYIGRLCRDLNADRELPGPEVECCPKCGYQLRVRNKGILRAIDIFRRWFHDGSPT